MAGGGGQLPAPPHKAGHQHYIEEQQQHPCHRHRHDDDEGDIPLLLQHGVDGPGPGSGWRVTYKTWTGLLLLTRVHPRLTEKMFSRPALDVAVEQDEVDDEEDGPDHGDDGDGGGP